MCESITSSLFVSVLLCLIRATCVFKCAEGFLKAALKADTAVVMKEPKDGEPAAKKICKTVTNSFKEAKR